MILVNPDLLSFISPARCQCDCYLLRVWQRGDARAESIWICFGIKYRRRE